MERTVKINGSNEHQGDLNINLAIGSSVNNHTMRVILLGVMFIFNAEFSFAFSTPEFVQGVTLVNVSLYSSNVISQFTTFHPANDTISKSNGETSNISVKHLIDFGAPKFINSLTGKVNYDKEFSSAVRVESANVLETKINALIKPEWINLRSEISVKVFAGSSLLGHSNGKGSEARFSAPYALAVDSAQTIYVADQADHRIRSISKDGVVSTVAGSIYAGLKDGLAADARFDTPSGIALDGNGAVYVSDQNNHSIRKISVSGVVTTIAGNQKSGCVDGKAFDAKFKFPAGICIDDRGLIYVADRGNNKIRVISPDGEVSTLAGSGKPGFSDGNGTSASFNAPTGITIDQSGFLYVTDQVNNRIRKISPTGDVTTVAGSGELDFRDGNSSQAAFKYPTGIIVDSFGNLYITDQLNHAIRKIDPSGKVSTISGNFESGVKNGTSSEKFKNPAGICLTKSGNIFVADYHNYSIKEVALDTRIYGTPSKSNIGDYKIVLQASNEFGSSILEGNLTVTDTVRPKLVATVPANLAVDVQRNSNLVLRFDEEIKLNDSGSITVSQGKELIANYTLSKLNSENQIAISEDQRSIIIPLKDLPCGTQLKISVNGGIVSDKANNEFRTLPASETSWTFTTRAKQKQTITVTPFDAKVYGDGVFKLGPANSSAGLPISYSSQEPGMVQIMGDSARILKAGTAHIVAVQEGNEGYLQETVIRTLIIQPRQVVVKPVADQAMTYGSPQPSIRFEISSGALINGDKFSGSLAKAKGDTVGVYMITLGSLSINNNYFLKLEDGSIRIDKAALLIKGQTQSKIAGQANPELTISYEGFVNGDGPDDLLNRPQLTCAATDKSFIGNYPINLSGAAAQNYSISYQSGELNVLPTGNADFTVHYVNLFENNPSGAVAATLQTKKGSNFQPIYSFAGGEGSSDNGQFTISGTSISSTSTFDFEQKREYFIRVKSEGEFGESYSQILVISIKDVNERPQMNNITTQVICSQGILQLDGITAGPEKGQEVKISIKASGSAFFELTHPINGLVQLSYNIQNPKLRSVNLQIIVKDNGGIENGGIDSTIYNYTLKVAAPLPVRIISEKGLTLTKGVPTVLSATGSGKFQWFFNNKTISGAQSSQLQITPNESGEFSVQVSNAGGCIAEAKIVIKVSDSPVVTATNLITANSDGINDSFVVRNIESYPGNELSIFDRSGRVVFRQKNYTNNWEATFNRSPLPGGTYYYLLDLGNRTEKMKGSIVVVR